MEGFDEEHVRAVLNIPTHVRVLFLLAIGHLHGKDGRYPGRFSPTRTIFSETYGQPFPMESAAPNRRSTRSGKTECKKNGDLISLPASE
jgi:hypothetical protein